MIPQHHPWVQPPADRQLSNGDPDASPSEQLCDRFGFRRLLRAICKFHTKPINRLGFSRVVIQALHLRKAAATQAVLTPLATNRDGREITVAIPELDGRLNLSQSDEILRISHSEARICSI